MRILLAICTTHMRLAWRGGHSGLAVAFLFIAVTLMPFGLGPELKLLRALAPGLLWVVLVMTVLVSLDRLFQEDFEDGSLDQLIGLMPSLELVVWPSSPVIIWPSLCRCYWLCRWPVCC